MSINRTKHSMQNIITGVFGKIVALIVPFILRTVILNVLGANYLGLNSLFSSILQLLNLTELGFSSAIVYSLYKPLEDDDYEKVANILSLIKSIYRIVALFILAGGLICLLFLDKLIAGTCPSDLNIYVLFILYLINTVVSYLFFSYRNCLLIALQRSDIKNCINTVMKIAELILQIIVLVAFKSMYLYIGVLIVCTIVNNMVSYYVTKVKYPQYECYGKVSKAEKKEILYQVLGILADKVCCVSRSSFDSIFISFFLGLEIVAKYDNYLYITNAMYSIINVLTTSLLASIGSSVAVEAVKKNYDNMKQLDFLFAWIYGWISVCLLCLYQPFMKIWVGENMMLSNEIVILFVVYFYTICMGVVRAIYVQASGIWWREKNRALIETVANLLLNLILVKLFGLFGVILATCISLFFINFLFGSRYIFKYYFGLKYLKEYLFEHVKYLFVTFIIAGICFMLCSMFEFNRYIDFLVKLVICIIVPNILCIVIVFNTKYKKYVIDTIIRVKGNLFSKRA